MANTKITVDGNFDDALSYLDAARSSLNSAKQSINNIRPASASQPTREVIRNDNANNSYTVDVALNDEYPNEYAAFNRAVNNIKSYDFEPIKTDGKNLRTDLNTISETLSGYNDYIADRGSNTSLLEDLKGIGDGSSANAFSVGTDKDGNETVNFVPPEERAAGNGTGTDNGKTTTTTRGNPSTGTPGNGTGTDNDRSTSATISEFHEVTPGNETGSEDNNPTDVNPGSGGNGGTGSGDNGGTASDGGNNYVDPTGGSGNGGNGGTGTDGGDNYVDSTGGSGNGGDGGTGSDGENNYVDSTGGSGKYGTEDKDDGSDDRVRNGEDPHLYGEDDAEEEYEKENGEGSLKQNGEKFGKNIDNEYDKQALKDYNDYDAAVKAAGIMAAFNEANDLFDNNTTLLATKLSNMGYTEAEISQIMQNRDLTVRAFTENQKNQELANISENIAHKNGNTSFKSGYRNRKIDLNIENGKDAKAAEELNENVDKKNGMAFEYSEKSSDDIDDLFAKAKNESVGMNSPDSLFKEESQVVNPNVVAEIIDTNAITADVGNKNILDLNGFINPKGGTGSILLNSLPIDLISVGVALAIKGASKLINGDKNEKLMINYDELAKYKYEKLDPKEIEQENERVMNEIESLYDNKEELSNRLKSFGYSILDINTMLVDNDLARKAILDGTRRFKLAELAKGLAAEDGIKDYKSSYIRDVTLADLNNGNAESLCVNLSLDADFNKLREEYFTLERDFVNSANKANDDLAILNEAKGKFNKFIAEHGDDTGSWTNEEYKEYEDLNKVSIDANRLFEQSNGRFNEIQATFMDIKNKYDSEKKSKIKEKINPLDLKQLMNA